MAVTERKKGQTNKKNMKDVKDARLPANASSVVTFCTHMHANTKKKRGRSRQRGHAFLSCSKNQQEVVVAITITTVFIHQLCVMQECLMTKRGMEDRKTSTQPEKKRYMCVCSYVHNSQVATQKVNKQEQYTVKPPSTGHQTNRQQQKNRRLARRHACCSAFTVQSCFLYKKEYCS